MIAGKKGLSYPTDMNRLLPNLVNGHISLVILPRGRNRSLLELAARIAWRIPLRVLDGGNCFNVYVVARELARYTAHVEIALERIQVARAFTCYQVLTLLQDTPADGSPTLVLNMLDTFYDESVSLQERQRLLGDSIQQLKRLGSQSSLGVSARWPKAELAEGAVLLRTLEAAADQVWWMEDEQPAVPLRLF